MSYEILFPLHYSFNKPDGITKVVAGGGWRCWLEAVAAFACVKNRKELNAKPVLCLTKCWHQLN